MLAFIQPTTVDKEPFYFLLKFCVPNTVNDYSRVNNNTTKIESIIQKVVLSTAKYQKGEDPIKLFQIEIFSSFYSSWHSEKRFIINKKRTTSVLTLVTSIGKTGFEPATPWSQTKYSTKLSYFPS